MRYIENADLREWVKESLRKAIFQKAHSLAVQTGCEILVKLEDTTDAKNSQYYATNTLQRAFRQSGIREKPGDRAVSGETGLPVIPTVDMAVQSCTDVYVENNVAFSDSKPCLSEEENNIDSRITPVDTETESSLIPMQLSLMNDADSIDSQFQSIQKSFFGESPSTSEQGDADILLQPQRPGLLPMAKERYTCQMCRRSFSKQLLLQDHISRSHMQPTIQVVKEGISEASEFLQGATLASSVPEMGETLASAVPSVEMGELDHQANHSVLPVETGEPSVVVLTYPTSLPRFSSLVHSALTENTVYQVWDQFIREVTDFYFPEMPQEDCKARVVYQHIGRTMFEKFPCIQNVGQTPWSHFNKSLSNKIRWRRQKRKHQTDAGGGGSGTSSGRPAKRPNNTSSSPSCNSPMEEIPTTLSSHSEEESDVKSDGNELSVYQQTPSPMEVPKGQHSMRDIQTGILSISGPVTSYRCFKQVYPKFKLITNVEYHEATEQLASIGLGYTQDVRVSFAARATKMYLKPKPSQDTLDRIAQFEFGITAARYSERYASKPPIGITPNFQRKLVDDGHISQDDFTFNYGHEVPPTIYLQ